MKRVSSAAFMTGSCESGMCSTCIDRIRRGAQSPNGLLLCTCSCHEGQIPRLTDMDAYVEGDNVITVDDQVKIYCVDGVYDAKVLRILAATETGAVEQVEVVTSDGRHSAGKSDVYRALRTVKPEQVTTMLGKRAQREVTEEMQLGTFEGELPKRRSGGRTRKVSPFDALVSQDDGTKHHVVLEDGDDAAGIKRQIQQAAKFAGKSAKCLTTDEGNIVFVTTEKVTRAKRAAKTAAAPVEAPATSTARKRGRE